MRPLSRYDCLVIARRIACRHNVYSYPIFIELLVRYGYDKRGEN
jgi:hypothetical protein